MGKFERGRSASTKGVAESRLNSRRALSRNATDPQSLLTPESLRDFIASQICPYCGTGPWKMLAGHTQKAHGVDRYELRRLAGVAVRDSICSDALSDQRVRSGKIHGIPDAAKEAIRERAAARRLDLVSFWAESDQDWPALLSIAEKFGLTVRSMRPELEKLGLSVPDGRKETTKRRPRLPRPPCEVANCTQPSVARRLCRNHYNLWRIEAGRVPACSVVSCDGPVVGRGLCGKHYARWRSNGTTESILRISQRTTCTIDGCNLAEDAKGLCKKHYARARYARKVGRLD